MRASLCLAILICLLALVADHLVPAGTPSSVNDIAEMTLEPAGQEDSARDELSGHPRIAGLRPGASRVPSAWHESRLPASVATHPPDRPPIV